MGNSDIIRTLDVHSWQWSAFKTKKGDPVILIRYYPTAFIANVVDEWLNVCNENSWIREKSRKDLVNFAKHCGVFDELQRVIPENVINSDLLDIGYLIAAVRLFENSTPPRSIEYTVKNGYPKILKRDWTESPVAV